MTSRHHHYLRWAALVLLAGLLAPSSTQAGPYLGDWGWCWQPAADCPQGQYPWLHYWLPEAYELRACLHPVNLDQYPPGPFPTVPASFEFRKSCCPSVPAMPTSPYSDPTAYYGRPIVPPK